MNKQSYLLCIQNRTSWSLKLSRAVTLKPLQTSHRKYEYSVLNNISRTLIGFIFLTFVSISWAATVVNYSFNDNLNDDSGHNHHGVLSGGTATYVTGLSGKALALNGSQFLVKPPDLIKGQKNFSITI